MSRLPRIVIAAWLFTTLGWVNVVAAEQNLSPAPEGTFSIVIIPDSQRYHGRGTKAQPDSTNEVTNAILDAHTRWIAANVQTQRIAFVTHVGDIVDRNVPEQWAVAKRCMDRLHGRVPYGVCAGNHDMKADGNTALFAKNFGPQRFADMPWYAGAFEGAAETATNQNGASSFQLFSAAGLDFVILHLECNSPDDMLAWADGILRTHARRRAIVTTHMGLGPLEKPVELDDFRDAPKGRMRWKKTHGERGNTPQQMWDKCFKKHDNLLLILSGDQSRSQAMHQVAKNENGKPVAEVMSDYNQEKTAWLRVCRFLPDKNRIEVHTVDSASGKLCAGTKELPDPARHQFSLDCTLSTHGQSDNRAPARPNIVFFLSDDHAAQAIGCYGGRLMKTPNIDRIAWAGVRFANCFCTESICAPSRATILTGKYGHVTGAMGWQPYDRRHKTLPEYLQAGGYQTALVGKYHLGNNPPGFDYFDIFPGQGRHRDPQTISKEVTKLHRGHSSDIIADLGLAWLEKRDRERPFLLCLHDKATHMPWQPAERFAKLFENETIPEPPTLLDDYKGRADWLKLSICRVDGINRWQEKLWGAPPAGLTREQECRWLYQTYMKHYLRCAAGLDENIGRVLDYLDCHGLANNTIVIYSSDQGFFLGEHGWFDKRWMQEESLRMPLIIRYPPLAKPGTVASALVQNTDFAPTLLDLASVAVPADMQGRSLRPILTGDTPRDWRKAIYYRYYTEEYGIPPQLGVRTERHKLIHYKGKVGIGFPPKQAVKLARWQDVDAWELFDLQSDPDEMVNLHDKPEHQSTVTALKAELARLRKELGDSKD